MLNSVLQGEDLHARLTNPTGLVIKSNVQLEKTKLEQEVKQLQLKISQLERWVWNCSHCWCDSWHLLVFLWHLFTCPISLMSSQQEEINKWKSRAIKLKGRSRAEGDRPSPPCTPTKRGLPMTTDCSSFLSSPKKFLVTSRKVLESPRKVLDSPKVSMLDSPESRFFDVGGSSELLSRSYPRQFFDNSSLGTIPGKLHLKSTPLYHCLQSS